MTSLEDRVEKLEKAVFNFIDNADPRNWDSKNSKFIGKLVINKEGKMEKELLKNGYTEKQILDMQVGMIDFITDGGKKPLDIPVTPVEGAGCHAGIELPHNVPQRITCKTCLSGEVCNDGDCYKEHCDACDEIKTKHMELDEYYDYQSGKYNCFKEWKDGAHKHGYTSEEDDEAIVEVWNDHGLMDLSSPNGETPKDRLEADAMIKFQQGYDAKQHLYKMFYDWGEDEYNEKTFMSKFLDGDLDGGYFYEAGTPEHFLLMAKWWIENNVPLHDHEKDHGDRKHWNYDTTNPDEHCPTHLAKFDVEQFRESEMYDPYIGLPFLAFNVEHDSFTKFKNWFHDLTGMCCSDLEEPHTQIGKDAVIIAWDQAWEDKKAYWNWKPSEYDELKVSLLRNKLGYETTQIEKNSLARIQRIHNFYIGDDIHYWYRKREFKDGTLDHINDDIEVVYYPENDELNSNEYLRTNIPHGAWVVEERSHLDVPNASCRGKVNGILVFSDQRDALGKGDCSRTIIGADTQTCHMEAEFGEGTFPEQWTDGNCLGWFHQQNNRWGRPTDHFAPEDGHCTTHKSEHDRGACKWDKHCDECVKVSAKYEAMKEKMRTNDAWWHEQIKNDYEYSRFEMPCYGKPPKWNKRDAQFLKKDACETCNREMPEPIKGKIVNGEKDDHEWAKRRSESDGSLTQHEECYKTWDELTKKEQEEMLECHSRYGGEEGWNLDYIFEYEELDKEIEELKAKQIDEEESKRCGFRVLKDNDMATYIVCKGGEDVCRVSTIEEAKIYAHHIDGCVLDSQDDNNGVFRSDGWDEAKECAKLDENCGKITGYQTSVQKEKVTCPKCNHNFELKTYLLPNPHEGKDES